MTAREVLDEPRRYFGWQENYKIPHEVEAAAIRRAALDLLGAQKSVGDICHEWNADPLLNTVFGGAWRQQVIEAVLRRRSNSPVLLHPALYARLLRHLDDLDVRLPPREVRRERTRNAINFKGKHLLSQVARCSECGDRAATSGDFQGAPNYRCRAHITPDHPLRRDGRNHGTCHSVPLDAAVREQMRGLVVGFDALDLRQQRALIVQHLTVTIYPRGTKPQFKIERKS